MSEKKVSTAPKDDEQAYFLPDYGVSVSATSQEEAIKKAKEAK